MNELIESYVAAGLSLISVVPNGKKALEREWQKQPKAEGPALQRVLNAMQSAGCNIGVRLDGDIVDLDFDRPEARRLSGLFFPECPAFRRDSLPADAPGHRLLRVTDAPGKVEKFAFGGKTEDAAASKFFADGKLCIAEIRNGTGCQTVFPPSAYNDGAGNKVRLVWNHPFSAEKLPVLPLADVRQRMARLAFASIALNAYPKGAGSRDEFCLKLAGALLALGWSAEEADTLIVQLASIAGDEEARSRHGKATTTDAKRTAGEQVNGLPGFMEYIGFADGTGRVKKWFGLADEKRRSGSRKQPIDPPDGSIAVGGPVHIRNYALAAALKDKEAGFYRRGATLVRVRRWQTESEVDGVPREAGSCDIATVEGKFARHRASEIGVTFHDGLGHPVMPDPGVFEELQDVLDQLDFAELEGLSNTPTMHRNTPGYDALSKLYLTFREDQYQDIPLKPTVQQAKNALAFLKDIVIHYEWTSPADRSVFLASCMSAVVRSWTRGNFPLFMFTAQRPGSGKTKLAQIAGLLNQGVVPAAGPFSPREEELAKNLFGYLIAGKTCILFDNVRVDAVASPSLERMLTSDRYSDRLLGANDNPEVSTRVLVLMTGNNLRPCADMVRRTLVCSLSPEAERPDERKFEFDPVQEVAARPEQYVKAVLTILRAYRCAGEPGLADLPAHDLPGLDAIRGALVWLGEPDPCDVVERTKEDSPDTEERLLLFSLLCEHEPIGTRFQAWQMTKLPDALTRLNLSERDKPNMALGKLLARHTGMTLDGVKLRVEKQYGGKVYWLEGTPGRVLEPSVQLQKFHAARGECMGVVA